MSRSRLPALVGALALTLAGAGAWYLVGPGRGEPPRRPEESLPEPPDGLPRESNFVTALAVANGRVHVGSAAGIVRLDPATGAFVLLTGTDDAALSGVSDLAAAPDGTVWSAHVRLAPPEEGASPDAEREHGGEAGEGGLRALAPDGTLRAWFEAEGLPGRDVACVAAGPGGVAAGVGRALLVLDLASGGARFEPRFGDDSRRVTLVDVEEGAPLARSVMEFRPRGEEVLAVAASGTSFHVGTTHGLYRLDPDGLVHFVFPCRDDHQVPSRVLALASLELAPGAPFGGVAASLAVPTKDAAGWRPGGAMEVAADLSVRCHESGVDVPDAPSLDVAAEGGTIWLATHEGLVRLRGRSVDLLDAAEGAPDVAVTAVAGDGAGGCWAGTWGAGVWRLSGREWTLYRFESREGLATVTRGTIRE